MVELFVKCRLCFEIIGKISELVSVARDNDNRCSHILGQVAVIRSILDDLEEVALSHTVLSSIDFLHRKLKTCDDLMNNMFDRKFSRPRDFLQGQEYSGELMGLTEELDSAVTMLNAALTTQLLSQRYGIQYSRRSEVTGPIPGKPTNLSISMRVHDQIELCRCPPHENAEAFSHYEVQYRRRW